MKKLLSLLIIGQVSCISPFILQSQTNTVQVKPASDACPRWNKQQVTSKADYFAYLRRRAVPQDPNNFYFPKYQNFNTQIAAKKAKQTDVEKNNQAIKKYDEPVLNANKEISIIKSVAKNTIKIAEETQSSSVEKNQKEIQEKDKAKYDSSTQLEDKKTASNKIATNIKRENMHSFRNICFKRKNATSCPNF